MKTSIVTHKKITRRTVLAIQAALDATFQKKICTVNFVNRREISVSAVEDCRQPFCWAFAQGFLSSRSA